jgi:hypothetical protein
MKNTVFRDVKPYSVVDIFRRFYQTKRRYIIESNTTVTAAGMRASNPTTGTCRVFVIVFICTVCNNLVSL